MAFVSGGTRGIGFAIAEKLARNGAHLVISYLRSRSDAEKAREKLSAFHTRVHFVRANMGNKEHIASIFQTIRSEFKHLDIIVHNAATGEIKPELELAEDEWQRALDINAKSLLLCAQLGVPLMHGRKGKIVSISSHGSQRCLPDYAAVGVAKAAVEALTGILRWNWPLNISVNAVMAGTTITQSLKGIPRHEEMVRFSKRTPAGRLENRKTSRTWPRFCVRMRPDGLRARRLCRRRLLVDGVTDFQLVKQFVV